LALGTWMGNMQEFHHVITDPEGLHARSAVIIANEAGKWRSLVKIARMPDDTPGSEREVGPFVEAKSLMALMALNANSGDTVVVCCDGPDERAASSAMQAVMRTNL